MAAGEEAAHLPSLPLHPQPNPSQGLVSDVLGESSAKGSGFSGVKGSGLRSAAVRGRDLGSDLVQKAHGNLDLKQDLRDPDVVRAQAQNRIWGADLGRDLGANPPYSERSFQHFEREMNNPEWRKGLLATSEVELKYQIGRKIAQIVEGGSNFREAFLEVGAQLAESNTVGPVNRDIQEWMKGVMFPIRANRASNPASESNSGSASSRSGSRSDVREDMQSKKMKIEAMEILGERASAPSNQVRFQNSKMVSVKGLGPYDVESEETEVEGGCALPSCVNAVMDAISAAVVGETELVCEPMYGGNRTQPVCVNAQVTKDEVLEGSEEAPDTAIMMEMPGNESENSNLCLGGSEVGSDEEIGEGESGKLVPDPGGIPDREVEVVKCGGAPRPDGIGDCSQPAVQVIRERPHDFLPPTSGVGLEEWVKIAKDKRKGRMHGGKPAKETGKNGAGNAASVPDLQVPQEPFPPLSGLGGARGGIPAPENTAGNLSVGQVPAVLSHDVVKKITWKDLLRSSKPTDLGVDLHFVEPTNMDGEPCAVFSVEEEAENMRNWQHTLLCYVVGKSPTYFQFTKAIQRLWKPPGDLEVFSRENGLFYCRFSSEEEMSRVIKDGPWYMEGKLIVVKKLGGATNCEEEMLSSIPIWVKLPGLPVKWWSSSGVSKVVSQIGNPLYFDVPSASQSRLAYARCCVEVAMEKPLPDSVLCVGGDKVRRRQRISYDWVPKKCSKCKEFGHLGDDCGKGVTHEEPKGQKGEKQGNQRRGGQQWVPRGAAQQADGEVTKELKQNNEEGKNKQGKVKLGVGGNMYSASMFNNRRTIRAANANSFQLLMTNEDEGPAELSEGRPCGKHSYFDSEDDPSSGGGHLEVKHQSAQQHSEESGDADNEEEDKEVDRVSISSKEEPDSVGGNQGLSLPQNAKAAKEAIEVEGHDIVKRDQDVAESEDVMQQGDSDFTKSKKKGKRERKKPAPVRPEGSRTTRHSGNKP